MVSRAQLLPLLFAFATALAGCQVGEDRDPVEQAILEGHVLSRIGYGPDAWSRTRIRDLGIEAYIREQLDPAGIADDGLEARLAAYPTLELDFYELVNGYADDPDLLFQPLLQLMRAKLLRSIHSRRQLEQVLVDFWFDHFNVYGVGGITNLAIVPYEREAIRRHVLGRFEDMLLAVARNPAMLSYLDNYLSSREGFEFRGEVRGLNENYARELLELHTVGVDGGYEQADVIEVARAFTGWTIGPEALAGSEGFIFWPAAHDSEPKAVMDELLLPPGGAEEDGIEVIRFLARHPKTAEFICTRLIERFVDESPPRDLVELCTAVYIVKDGDLGQVTQLILSSDAFLDAERAGAKVKRPLVFAASLARATGIQLEGELLDGVVYYLGLLGEPLYQAHPPTGYPDLSSHWASGGTLISRFNLITHVTEADLLLGIDWGVENGTPGEIVDAVAEHLLPVPVEGDTRRVTVDHLEQMAPAPPHRVVREAAALLLSSPDFMRH